STPPAHHLPPSPGENRAPQCANYSPTPAPQSHPRAHLDTLPSSNQHDVTREAAPPRLKHRNQPPYPHATTPTRQARQKPPAVPQPPPQERHTHLSDSSKRKRPTGHPPAPPAAHSPTD